MNASPAVESRAAPDWRRPLFSTLAFLGVGAAVLVPILAFDLPGPPWLLYAFGTILGVTLAVRSLADPEWLLATIVLYLPFNKLYVAPMGPGINGTNALEALLALACVAQAMRGEPAAGPRPAATTLMAIYAALSIVSMLTGAVAVGPGQFLASHALDIKGWLDQYFLFFAFLYLVRDAGAARRLVVYMMVGTLVVLATGVSEWLSNRNLGSIEHERVLGPQMQPNDHGAFLVYGLCLFLALLLRNLGRPGAWLTLAPTTLMIAKIVVATFSRGAYLAMGFAGIVATWLRGKALLLAGAVVAAALLAAAPQLMPHSIQERMSQTGDVHSEETMDTSSRTRLVLWQASLDMIAESPLLGKGFKMFPVYKGAYTEYPVPEADNHNMYLYIASQMGIPALLVFLLILARMFRAGLRVYRGYEDGFASAAGLAAASMVAAALVVNMFGSRMVDLMVSAYVWITLVAVARLESDLRAASAVPQAARAPLAPRGGLPATHSP